MGRAISSTVTFVLSALVVAYRAASRGVLPPSCRQIPSCSEFTLWALKAFGPQKGLSLSWKRFMQCHPFGSRASKAREI